MKPLCSESLHMHSIEKYYFLKTALKESSLTQWRTRELWRPRL